MKDIRIGFLSKETERVINYTIGLASKLRDSHNDSTCDGCKTPFATIKLHNPFIFLIIKDFFNLHEDDVKFCCLKCCHSKTRMLEVVELYPSLKLIDIKKLMYYHIFKKFVFNFDDCGKTKYKKYAVVDNLEKVLKQMLDEKCVDEEITTVHLKCDERVVAEDDIHSMRIEYGKEYVFDRPPAINAQLIQSVNKHCVLAKYYLEVYYKKYDAFSPFSVSYNSEHETECSLCENKINKNSGHPIFYCSVCGITPSNYYAKRRFAPFWLETKYDHKKLYWAKAKKRKIAANLLLYGVDIRK
ncbi:ME53 [Plodia interpunctella granulovirus]|uniref:ME53 n=1 Tax=Plodia interpunctella granulovirus TaxID=262175 RepID=A0A1L5JH52_9BBAC|nr:ME53 [Plodia interpunctella granulovirus]APO14007.1 ME53 [Plodia interpunctella granulovirus]